MDMNPQDICDTGLSLGLGICPMTNHHRRRRESCSPCANLTADRPSLTLSLSDDVYGGLAMQRAETNKAREEGRPAQLPSPHSAASSYAMSVKKEKDVGGEDVEVERVSSRVSDEEDDSSARKKLRLTKEQSALLEDRFREHSTLNPKQKQALAKQLNLRPRQVEVWFQNRRARTKLKQNEVDCEILKRCYERLTNENQRLQKELQELKALKFAPPQSPLYMQFPAATLTMCPSCERMGGGSNESSKVVGSAGPVVVPPKPGHFFNPFTHSSAAC